MEDVTRFGVSMDRKLLGRFDKVCRRKGYTNRSEAIRDLIRDRLVDEDWSANGGEVVGTLTLVYDHETREVQDRLTGAQHEHHGTVVSSMHVHLDHHHCLEVLVLRGKPERVRKLADRLLAMRGVKHGKLVSSGTGKGL